jgi:hypothetical protein
MVARVYNGPCSGNKLKVLEKANVRPQRQSLERAKNVLRFWDPIEGSIKDQLCSTNIS